MKKLTIFVALVAAIVTLGVFSGCKPKGIAATGGRTAASALNGKLVYWSSWNPTEPQAQTLQAAAKEFSVMHPGVQIEFVFNGRDNSNLLVPALQSSQKIDLYDGNVDRCFNLWKDNSIVLNDYFKKSYPTTNGKAFEDSILKALVMLSDTMGKGNKIFVPYMPQAFLWFYNRDIFKAAGIESTPKTWDEFMAVCEKIKKAGYTPITLDDAYAEQNFGYYLSRLKGNDWVLQLVNDTSKKMWDDPAVLQTAKAFEEMAKKGYYAPNAGSNRFPAAQQEMVIEEKIAMYLNGTWLPNEVKGVTGPDFPWGQFAYPVIPGGVDSLSAGAISSFGIAINNKCESPDAAFNFAVFVTTGKWDAEMSKACMAIPLSPDSEWPKQLQDTKVVFEAITSRYPQSTSIVLNPNMLPVIRSNVIKLLSGSITAEQFVKAMKS